MRPTPERAALILAVAAALGAGGCAVSAPARWLPAPAEYPRFPYGAAAVVQVRGAIQPALRGEFIALGADTIFVLNERGLVAMPLTKVRRIQLTADRNAQLRAPTLHLGSFGSPRRPVPDETREALRSFARFPGGLPDSLDRGSLQMPPSRGWE